VRAGDTVYVSGTVAVDGEGRIAPTGDPYGQARRCLEIISQALAAAGASIGDVVRTRMFVLDPEVWEEVGRAHGEVFGETKPATTLVAVAGLVDPEALVEIEAVAVIG
jgi:enamine deaminase RidA (YjgF/YER057c/UK114 family)